MNQIFKFKLYGFLKNQKYFEPFLILFFISKDLSFTYIGFLIAIRALFTNIFEIPSGYFADAYCKKKTIISSCLFYIFCFLIFFISKNNVYYFVAMILWGLGDAFRSGTHKSIIMEHLDNEDLAHSKLKIYGSTRSWALFGSAFSSFLSILLFIFFKDYSYLFLFSLFAYLLLFILLLSYPDYKCQLKRKEDLNKDIFKQIKNSFNLKLLVNTSFYEAFFKYIKDMIQPFIISFVSLLAISSLSKTQKIAVISGSIYAFINIFSALISKYSYLFIRSDKKNEYIIDITTLISGMSYLISGILYYFYKDLGTILTICVIITNVFIFNIRKPFAVSLYGDKISKHSRTSILSFESQLKTIFIIIIAPLSGVFIDNIGIYSPFIIFGISLSSVFFLLKLNKK